MIMCYFISKVVVVSRFALSIALQAEDIKKRNGSLSKMIYDLGNCVIEDFFLCWLVNLRSGK